MGYLPRVAILLRRLLGMQAPGMEGLSGLQSKVGT